MAVSLTHTTVAVGTNAGNGEIAKEQWNEGHTLTAAANSVLARAAATGGAVSDVALSASQLLGRGSTGDVAAIGVSADLSISGTTLGIGSSVATLTGAQELTNKTINGSSNTITNVSLSTGVTGFLPVGNGGTGAATLALNNVLLGNGTSAVQEVAPGTNGNVLTSNGTTWVSAAPSGGGSLLGATDSATPFETFLGYQAGNVNTGVNNTFVGYRSGLLNTTGTSNTAVGYLSLDANTTGINSSAFGDSALGAVTTASGNSAFGSGAGRSITISNNNSAFGYLALFSLTTGESNVAVGAVASGFCTTGSFNCAFGTETLGGNGSNNSAFGHNALKTNSGSNNTAFGYFALNVNAAGTRNVAIGHEAGDKIAGGSDNTVIGASAGSSGTNDLTTGSNNTVIGYNAATSSATISNTITLGNSSIATLRCQVTTITALSDARDKSNISELIAGLRFVKALRPVSFDWNMRDGGKVGIPDTGFIAQELLLAQEQSGEIIPGLVYDDNPDRLEAGYGKLIPVLVKAIQELSAEVDRLRNEIKGGL